MNEATTPVNPPYTPNNLQHFKDALLIVKTGRDAHGDLYSKFGILNQAAWIGERSGFLIEEIEQLRDIRKVLVAALKDRQQNCCEFDGSPDGTFHYCDQCKRDMAAIRKAGAL